MQKELQTDGDVKLHQTAFADALLRNYGKENGREWAALPDACFRIEILCPNVLLIANIKFTDQLMPLVWQSNCLKDPHEEVLVDARESGRKVKKDDCPIFPSLISC